MLIEGESEGFELSKAERDLRIAETRTICVAERPADGPDMRAECRVAVKICELAAKDQIPSCIGWLNSDLRPERVVVDLPELLAEIGYHAVRTGDNPGEHTIVFGMLGETIELRVASTNRDSYALGAIGAAKFIAGKPPGLYGMDDVLGLTSLGS